MDARKRQARQGGKAAACLMLVFCLFGAGSSNSFASVEDTVPLQPLIDAAAAGETLVLTDGRVYAGPAVVSKPMTIRSSGAATVTNGSDSPAITLAADGIVLQSLRVLDEQTNPKKAAILVQSDRNRIERLHIATQAGGIYLRNANDNAIMNNRIEGADNPNRKTPYSKRGNGVDLLASARNVIEGNAIARVHDGIYVESSNETSVVNNYAVDSRYGYHFMFSGKPELLNNAGERNVTGAMVMGVEGAVVKGNRFRKQSENVNSQGILLFDVHRSLVSGNVVEGNRVGFYIENSTENWLEDNAIERNFIGLQMLQSNANTFTRSSFAANVIQAQSTDSKDNSLRNNYWDDLNGLDANGDGTSDISYEVDPFFIQLTKNIDAFQIFFQSPGMPFLAQMFHADTANWLKDAEPLLEPTIRAPEEAGADSVLTLLTGLLLLGSTIFIIYQWGYRKS